MNKEYIKIEDTRYRVCINMNAIEAFAEYKGWKQLAKIMDLADMSFADSSALMYFSLIEGERMDGKVYPLTLNEQKSKTTIIEITQFVQIFEHQCSIKTDTKSVDDSKKKRWKSNILRN